MYLLITDAAALKGRVGSKESWNPRGLNRAIWGMVGLEVEFVTRDEVFGRGQLKVGEEKEMEGYKETP